MQAPIRLVSAQEEITKHESTGEKSTHESASKQKNKKLVSVMRLKKTDEKKPIHQTVYQTVYQTTNQDGWTVPEQVEYAAPPK